MDTNFQIVVIDFDNRNGMTFHDIKELNTMEFYTNFR